MKQTLLCLAAALALPSFAMAHVSVRPRESKPHAEERYTVRVPTEGAVATTHVQLEIPAGVTVLEVLPHDGATFETAKEGGRITAITWRKEIAPKAVAEFLFRARNPNSGDLVWKAHQHFSDGTVADWVGPAGDRRPASVTKLAAGNVAGSPGPKAVVSTERPNGGPAASNNVRWIDLRATCRPEVSAFERFNSVTQMAGQARWAERFDYRSQSHGSAPRST